jgi:hypothetical protein
MSAKRKAEQTIIDKLDCCQLNSQSNNVDVYAETLDKPSDFASLDSPCDQLIANDFQTKPVLSETEPIILEENQRFCKDRTNQLNQIMKGEKA